MILQIGLNLMLILTNFLLNHLIYKLIIILHKLGPVYDKNCFTVLDNKYIILYLGLVYGLAISIPIVVLILAILAYFKFWRYSNPIYYDSDPGLIAPTKLG